MLCSTLKRSCGGRWLPSLRTPRSGSSSDAPFFLVSEDRRYPTEDQTEAISEGVFEGSSVGDIMTPAAFSVGPEDSVSLVAKFLLQGRIHRALVVEEGRLRGILTTFDPLRAFVGN